MDNAVVDEDSLSIPIPSAENLQMDDYRRLTGPGLMWEKPGGIVDVFFSGFKPEDVVRLWRHHARAVLDAIGWQDQQVTERVFDGGANLALSGPMDQLYSAMFAAQTAWHFCAAELLDQQAGDFDDMISALKQVMVREANPSLIALIEAAQHHGIDVLSDDDDLSLGHGFGSCTWPVTALPVPDDVNWDELHDVPVALITGTNGKTTTTRLCAAIGAAAGLVAGLTSTEFVRVGDDILDMGDYSGPGGARMLLRDKRLEIAFLEVARGGILRRGLPLRRARAALVNNVAADHLGQYGVNTVEELAAVKFAVHRTLAVDGVLVLNADDAYVLGEAKNLADSIRVWWFSLDPMSFQIKQARANNIPCAWLAGTMLVFFDGQVEIPLVDVQDIPVTMGGAALFNIYNALGALCLARALGLSDDAIRGGLSGFQNDAKDNPGRCNEFAVKGARVFVDFAHNPHSIAAVTQAMAGIEAKRRFVLLSHAGDRSDQDIRDVTQSAFDLKPDYVVAAELPAYLRGRGPGEVSALIREACKAHGMQDDQVILADTPSRGVAQILEQLEPNDLALLFVLSERDAVFEMLDAASD